MFKDVYSRGLEFLQNVLARARIANLKPPPKLTLSQWADEYAFLSRETSAEVGKFQCFGYQRGMLDAVTDPAVTTISIQKSARVGYTKLMDHAVGYFIHADPSPILVVQPRVEDAESYSKTEIAPMLRDTPVLAAICGDPKAKSSDQTILEKTFKNGSSLKLVGANSPAGFRRVTSRIVLFDEVDGYPNDGAGSEGDQIALGTKRTETFWNRKIILGSTPTVKGYSRIEKSFLQSDQRRYFVPCPHCGEYQVLEWGGPDLPYGMKWDRDEEGNGLPETVHYVCKHNGCIIHDADKPEMDARGEWRATAPFNGHAGFHIWAGYSLFPNAAWSNIVAEWLKVKDDPLARQTFINLVLGETYEDAGEKALNHNRLMARCELWPADVVPDTTAVITIGVDTQDYRFELEAVAWGRNDESWSIAYEVIEGDMETPEPWERLDAFLKQTWRRADGREFVAEAVCIDSGGHHTQKVYAFSKERLGRKVWAIKGESAVGGKRSPVWPTKKPTRRKKSSFSPVILGVNTAKDVIRSRLHLNETGPGYMHFPADRDMGYFEQLTSERSIVKYQNGQKFRVWDLPGGRANEALDCRVYAYGALCGLVHLGLQLNKRADFVGAAQHVPLIIAANGAPRPGPVMAETVADTPTAPHEFRTKPSLKPSPLSEAARFKRKSLISRLA